MCTSYFWRLNINKNTEKAIFLTLLKETINTVCLIRFVSSRLCRWRYEQCLYSVCGTIPGWLVLQYWNLTYYSLPVKYRISEQRRKKNPIKFSPDHRSASSLINWCLLKVPQFRINLEIQASVRFGEPGRLFWRYAAVPIDPSHSGRVRAVDYFRKYRSNVKCTYLQYHNYVMISGGNQGGCIVIQRRILLASEIAKTIRSVISRNKKSTFIWHHIWLVDIEFKDYQNKTRTH